MARANQRGRTEAEYRRLVARQARSGLSIREFAEREGIRVQTLYWWRSELRRRDRAKESGNEFVRVSVRPSSEALSGDGFDVELPGGVRVRVPARFDEDELVRLLNVVRRSC